MSDPLGLDGAAVYLESLMVDECEIFEFLDKEEFAVEARNEATGEYETTEPLKSYLYSGKCMIYSRAPSASPVEEGGINKMLQSWGATLPRTFTTPVKPESILQVTSVHYGGDETLVGKRYCLDAVDGGTFIITREFSMTEKKAARR